MVALLVHLAPFLVFGVVVFVHELGHFLAAKAVDVYAPRFSIGFGPALVRKRWGETEYVVALLPLGGYVRMASRQDEEMAFIEGGNEEPVVGGVGANGVPASGAPASAERPAEWDPDALAPFGPHPVPEHRWFESKPLVARLFIMIAGVTMNVLLALAVTVGLAAHYGRTVVATRVIGGIHTAVAPAALSKLRVGDTITAIAGKHVGSWNDVTRELRNAPIADVAVVTQRGTVVLPLGDAGTEERSAAVDAIDFYRPPVIDSVIAGLPGERAGLRAGDSVVAVNEVPVRSFSDIVAQVAPSAGKPVPFDIVRRGSAAVQRLTIVPAPTEDADPATGQRTSVGKIGAAPRDMSRHEEVALGEAIGAGARATWAMAGDVVGVVHGLFARRVSFKQLGGPIAIARTSVAAARNGLEPLLLLLAFLSVNIAVLNLLPIPILDGGQIVLNVLETIKGSAFSVRTREYIVRVGLVFIGLLFVTVMWNDITRWVGELVR